MIDDGSSGEALVAQPRASIALAARVRSLWQWLAGSREERAYRLAIIACLVLGIALRMIGAYVRPTSFWYDEAQWTARIYERSLLENVIRPMGYVWISRHIADLFGASEFWLRFLPNTASIVTLLLIPYVGSQLLLSKVSRFLFVLIWAIHPALIDYANEFKPYSIEVLIHLIPLLLYLRYRETGRRSYVYILLAALPVFFLFAYNAAFTYPGILLWALWDGWRHGRLRGVLAPVMSGLVCALIVAGIYKLTLHRASTKENEEYWGQKYDVFYTKAHAEGARGKGRLAWMAEKYADMAALPGVRRELWQARGFVSERAVRTLSMSDRGLWLGLHLLGLIYVLARRRDLFPLVVAPYLVLILLNVLGRWPMGAFRTNLFLAAYMLLLPFIGFDRLIEESRPRTLALTGLIGALTLLPGFTLGFSFFQPKSFWGTRNHQGWLILEKLRGYREARLKEDPDYPRERVVFDCYSWKPYVYYMRYHPVQRQLHRNFFRKNFLTERRCQNTEQSMRRRLNTRLRHATQPFWVVLSKPALIEDAGNHLRETAAILKEEHLGTDHVIFLVFRGRTGTVSEPRQKRAATVSEDDRDDLADDGADDDGADDADGTEGDGDGTDDGAGDRDSLPGNAAPKNPTQ